MASLTKKTIRGRSYFYLRECQRVEGKPKIVWQEYLGSPQQLVSRLMRPEPQEVSIREFGAVATAYKIAEQLGVVSTIDRHISKRGKQGPTVGQYLLIAALNRCVSPCSKAQMAEWYQGTVLPRLMGIKASQLSSQRFWDNMDRINEKAIGEIERELTAAAVSRFNLDLNGLLFDATNFFTFIDSFNGRSKLAQRGHSKDGRDHLRILGLALLVTSDGEIPLFHRMYAGNQNDTVTFSSVLGQLIKRCQDLAKGVGQVTLVFDKGNNSRENLAWIDRSSLHFVGSLVPTQHADLLAIPRSKMHRLDRNRLTAVWAYRTRKQVFGIERTVLVTYNSPFFRAQIKTLNREIHKRRLKLKAIKDSLTRHHQEEIGGSKPTVQGIRNRVQQTLAARHMKDLFRVQITAGSHGIPDMKWRLDKRAWKHLKETLLGKTLLFTNRHDWSDEDIVLAYRSQFHVEAAFRSMKNPHFLSFRPTHHWTDQKLRVHAFYCVLALTLVSLMRRILQKAGLTFSIEKMIQRLADIREVILLYPTPKALEPRTRTVLSKHDRQQVRMLRALGLPDHGM